MADDRSSRSLEPALRDLVSRFREETGLEVQFEVTLSAEPPERRGSLLYRIVQEALTNVRKHARASRVWLLIQDADGGFRLEVTDNGQGFDPTRPQGRFGLRTLDERARAVGGWVRVTSVPRRGTLVEAWLPADG